MKWSRGSCVGVTRWDLGNGGVSPVFGMVAQLWSTCHDIRDRGVNAVLYGTYTADAIILRTYRTCDCHSAVDIDLIVACIVWLLTSLSLGPILTDNHKSMAAFPNVSQMHFDNLCSMFTQIPDLTHESMIGSTNQ